MHVIKRAGLPCTSQWSADTKLPQILLKILVNYIHVKATERNGKNALDIAKYELYQCAAEDTKGTSDKMKFYLNIIEELEKKLG